MVEPPSSLGLLGMKLLTLCLIVVLLIAPFAMSLFVNWRLQVSATPPTPADLAQGIALVIWTRRIAWTGAAVLAGIIAFVAIRQAQRNK